MPRKRNTCNDYRPREAARCVPVLPPVQNARLSDMVLYSISVTTVRYGTVYSAVKNYSTYGTQQYGTQTNPLRGTVPVRYGTEKNNYSTYGTQQYGTQINPLRGTVRYGKVQQRTTES